MPDVNPAILKWARETAGLALEDAAAKLDVGDARGVAGPDRLAALEAGEAKPTRPLLIRMAAQYRRPLLTFYLSEPPAKGARGQDFRTLPPEHSRRDDALVDALIRDVRARQGMVRALLEAEDEATPLPFVGSVTMREGAAAVLASIVDTLSLNLAQFRGSPGYNRRGKTGFAYLREQAERAGVFVLLIGNLGSHQSNIDIETFRGLALADPIAPFVVVNDQDAQSAWSFTLLHELAHIWLGETGVSGANPSAAVERFCNDVAARFLLPTDEIRGEKELSKAPFETVLARINQIAEERNISRSVVAYKLLREGLIAEDVWLGLSALFRKHYKANKEAERSRDRDGSGGPNYYTVRRHRVGARMIDLARRMLADGALVPSKAAKLLGVKPANVYALVGEGGLRSRTQAA